MAATEKNAPVRVFRFGRIKACIWRNETKHGPMFTTTIVRLFKRDGEDEWEESHSFNRDDLPLVEKLADACSRWIYATEQKERKEQRQEGLSEVPF